jgi:acetyl esterase/lipase
MTIPSTTSEITATRYAYGSHGEQFGELRAPTGDGLFPTVVYVHGGGYRAQVTLAGAAGICSALTQLGYATWSIEYRRGGNGGEWPAMFDDVQAAANHIYELAKQAPLDLSHCIVAGQSAGGQLALYLAKERTNGNASLPDFRAVLALAPATNLRQLALDGGSAIAEMLGGPDEVPERYASTSPIEMVPIGLPQLVVHGTADSIVPLSASEAYVEVARAAGDPVELARISGADHLDLWSPRRRRLKRSFTRRRNF